MDKGGGGAGAQAPECVVGRGGGGRAEGCLGSGRGLKEMETKVRVSE